jgi:hypothetical protein
LARICSATVLAAQFRASLTRQFAFMEADVAKLGSPKRPAVVRVQSTEKAEEIVGLAQARGWSVTVGVEPNQIEELFDLREPMRTAAKLEVKPRLPPKISGNDYSCCRGL